MKSDDKPVGLELGAAATHNGGGKTMGPRRADKLSDDELTMDE